MAKIDKLESLINKLATQRVEEKYKTANTTPHASIGEATLSAYDKSMAKGDVRGMLLQIIVKTICILFLKHLKILMTI